MLSQHHFPAQYGEYELQETLKHVLKPLRYAVAQGVVFWMWYEKPG